MERGASEEDKREASRVRIKSGKDGEEARGRRVGPRARRSAACRGARGRVSLSLSLSLSACACARVRVCARGCVCVCRRDEGSMDVT
jgi:hypothetical protein